MNWWIIIGGSLTLIGGLLSLYGGYIAQKHDSVYKDQVIGYIQEENEANRPIIKVMSVKSLDNKGRVLLTITNHGKKPAIKPTLIFTEHSMSMGKDARMSFSEMPNDQQVTAEVDLLFGMNRNLSLPQEWTDFLGDFNSSKKAVVAEFYIEYQYEQQTYRSPEYTILYTNNGHAYVSPKN